MLLTVLLNRAISGAHLICELAHLVLEPVMGSLHGSKFLLPLEVKELIGHLVCDARAQCGIPRDDRDAQYAGPRLVGKTELAIEDCPRYLGLVVQCERGFRDCATQPDLLHERFDLLEYVAAVGGEFRVLRKIQRPYYSHSQCRRSQEVDLRADAGC